ncbi:MAG: hypothetical protein ACPLPT_10775 [Moorellales bacterium]
MQASIKEVYPILRRRGIPAAVFVITGSVDQGRHLSWEQMKQIEQDTTVHIRFYVHARKGHGFIDTNGDGVPDAHFYVGRKWLPEKGRQETVGEYLERVRTDLRAAGESIRVHLGHDSPYLAVLGGLARPPWPGRP